MEQKECNERISSFLKRMNVDINAVSSKNIERLNALDEAIQKRLLRQNNAKQELKNANISKTTLIEDTGIPRRTLYNNDILIKYIDQFETKEDENEIDKLRDEKRIMSQTIQNISSNVLDCAILNEQIQELYKDIERLTKANASLADQKIQLEEEISAINKKYKQLEAKNRNR